jgi:hypothetical protein
MCPSDAINDMCFRPPAQSPMTVVALGRLDGRDQCEVAVTSSTRVAHARCRSHGDSTAWPSLSGHVMSGNRAGRPCLRSVGVGAGQPRAPTGPDLGWPRPELGGPAPRSRFRSGGMAPFSRAMSLSKASSLAGTRGPHLDEPGLAARQPELGGGVAAQQYVTERRTFTNSYGLL